MIDFNKNFTTTTECTYCGKTFGVEVRGRVLTPEMIWTYQIRTTCDECVYQGKDSMNELLNQTVEVVK